MKRLFLLLLPVLFISCSSLKITERQETMVPAGKTEEQVKTAIKAAGSQRGWSITSEKKQEMEATLNVRSHMLKIKIPYDSSKFKFVYIESQNLNYNPSNQSIHKKAYKWLNKLEKDILSNLR